MPRTTVSLLKFVGTVSLGLLTGISYTTSTQSLPSLLALPTAATANSSFLHHQRRTERHLSALVALAVSSYGLAFCLSPPRGGRHPYLLWTSIIAAVGHVTGTLIVKRGERKSAEQGYRQGRRMSDAESDEGYVDATGASTVELNGEEVRTAMQNWQVAEMVRAGISGLAFFMGVVGLWGDGVGSMRR